MKWFGKLTTARYDAEEDRIAAPVGRKCEYCCEPIGKNDSGLVYDDGSPIHRNCHLRQVIGPVAHIELRCGCFVKGSTEADPPGMTRRQAADAAVEAFERKKKAMVN